MNEIPSGIQWPRFEDGELVKIGDKFTRHYDNGRACTVDAITFKKYGFDIHDFSSGKILFAHYGEGVKRPPLIAKDGLPIIVGETLYGEDGKAWTIARHDGKHAWTYGDKKRLKPEWLSHEQPDSLEAIASELRRIYEKAQEKRREDNSVNMYRWPEKMLEFAERIEALDGK